MHIYDKDLNYVGDFPYDLELILKTYPQYQKDHYFSERKINYPKLDNGEIVEKTKYDLYLDNIYKLQDGEVIQDNDIITIPIPNNLLKPIWKNMEWVESATLEEAEEYLRNKIIDKNDELMKIRTAGFNKFNLETELENLRAAHMDITHQIAMKGAK